ncbi:MAG: argininosuccinate lyase [Paludibacter sp. 47-17]|nr:MAG: argininosuccinate lyase [Paludibacter sp. SCN 50-10]OJX91236.1 MAG: argininosuccinate lyase [Paludibacter sp. 47-17]
MASKIWEKNIQVDKKIEQYTVGRDREMDAFLAASDVLGSMAHITMLESVGLLQHEELSLLLAELKNIYAAVEAGTFRIEDDVEDVHSQVELLLTRRLGDLGKKIHSGRSRNDQVLVDLKIHTRSEIESLVERTDRLIEVLLAQSERYKNVLLPGYTHFQIAMPSSFGLWFAAYAEGLADDLQLMQAAWKITNRNPLGSAAGYGSSFPLNRQLTTDLLGFDTMNYNVVYAQMGRGKMERTVATAMAAIAATVARLAYDACLYNSQNFGFIRLPDQFTTGSSIMPHKKNPDVFELTRAKCNKLQGIPQQITLITNNLPSGYFRDLQLIKEVFLPAFAELNDILDMTTMMMESITVNENILDDPRYDYLFSVETVNRLTLSGVAFRDAYKQVGMDIEAGNYQPDRTVNHTHEGSIGNLCNDRIREYKNEILTGFGFERVQKALAELLK